MVDTSQGKGEVSLQIAKAPSACRLCKVELQGSETWRAHVKSDRHVYNLRSKIAEPGTVLTNPTIAIASDNKSGKSTAPFARRRDGFDDDADRDEGGEAENESDLKEGVYSPEFVPGQCLFCAQESDELDDNLTHMAGGHGFTVPFQEFLAVDIETVVEYLHFVIHTYRECICCGMRRNTVEGVRQHMVDKGHCRYDLSEDTQELYEIPQVGNALTEQTQRDVGMPVRLPSGKLVSNRKHVETPEPRAARKTTQDRGSSSSAARPEASPGLEVAQRDTGGDSGGRQVARSSEALFAAQLSRLRIAGERVQQKEEQRKRGRLEQANNSVKMKHYRLDAGDSRFGRQF